MARVLLAYANPAVTAQPVPPYGLECVAHAFRAAGCEVEIVSPFIEDDAPAALAAAIARVKPAMVGLSVRNLDDALVVRSAAGEGDIDTTDYTGEVGSLVDAAIALLGRDSVVLGGAALAAAPGVVGRRLGARWVIAGPAEDLCWRAGRALATTGQFAWPEDARVHDLDRAAPIGSRRAAMAGWRPVPGPTPRDGAWLRLAVARGGRVAVNVTTGCDRRCHFCVEAAFTGGAVRPRAVDDVVTEVRLLAQAGARRFWLACSEFNVPGTAHGVAVLRALASAGLARPGGPLDFATFIQPAPVDDALLDAFEACGIDPSGLSFEFGHLDDRVLRAGGGPCNRRQIDRLVNIWQGRGYRVLGGSVLLGAHPSETEETLESALATAREIDGAFPDGFGLAYACGARMYPGSTLSRLVDASGPGVYAAGDIDLDLVRPVVYCRPWSPRVLLARVAARLQGTRAPMRPMNAEASDDRSLLAAEKRVNRGIVRLHERRFIDALEAFDSALELAPTHLEALSQAAQASANGLGDIALARAYLSRLQNALPPGDHRRAEVGRAVASLG